MNRSIPYLIPFIAYILVISLVPGIFADVAKVILVGGLLMFYWSSYIEIKYSWSWTAPIVGALVILIWVGPELLVSMLGLTLPAWYGGGEGYNPLTIGKWALAFRLLASILIAPVVEELFVRSWLARYAMKKEFWKIKVGEFDIMSFVLTALFFGFSHERWVVGLISAVILNVYLMREKDIFSVIQAHAWANLLLAAIVLWTGRFGFW